MGNNRRQVRVELVAQKKGCLLCGLAVAILEEIQSEFEAGALYWEVVDVGSREEVIRHAELGKICPAGGSIARHKRTDRLRYHSGHGIADRGGSSVIHAD